MRLMNLCIDGEVVGAVVQFPSGDCLVHYFETRFASLVELHERCQGQTTITEEESHAHETIVPAAA